MVSHKYKDVMKKSEQLEAYNLFLRDWKLPEIATELKKSTATIRNWSNRYDWRTRKMFDLRDIEQEMLEKAQKAREQILDIGTQTLTDVFIRDPQGNIVGVTIAIEDIKDLRSMVDVIMKTAGIADKIETKTETKVTGDISVKTEAIDPEMAAEIGKLMALKASQQVEEVKE